MAFHGTFVPSGGRAPTGAPYGREPGGGFTWVPSETRFWVQAFAAGRRDACRGRSCWRMIAAASPCGTISGVPTLCIAQDAAADDLLGRDPLALLIGMLLDQHTRQRSS